MRCGAYILIIRTSKWNDKFGPQSGNGISAIFSGFIININQFY